MTLSVRELPTEMEILAAVCVLLVRHPEERPSVAELASVFNHGERALRHRWYRAGREPLGSLVAYGCSLRAAWLVSVEGWKCDSATREVGHARSWSLNRQLLRRLGVTLSDCRNELPERFNWTLLCRTFVEVEARIRDRVEISA